MGLPTMTDYPFHTATIDGEEVVGILFVAGNGLFYEFQDPDTHDDFSRYECPRTGEVMTYTGTLDRLKKKALGGHVRSRVPAETWAAFREQYVNADEAKTEAWRDTWSEMHQESLEESAKK